MLFDAVETTVAHCHERRAGHWPDDGRQSARQLDVQQSSLRVTDGPSRIARQRAVPSSRERGRNSDDPNGRRGRPEVVARAKEEQAHLAEGRQKRRRRGREITEPAGGVDRYRPGPRGVTT